MKQYKALVIDLDGTTVPHLSNSVSPRVLSAIHAAHEFVTVCVATGRLLKNAQEIIAQLKLTGPCVINNGCQIVDPISNTILSEVLIEKQLLPDIAHTLRDYAEKAIVSDGSVEIPLVQWNTMEKVMSFFINDISEEHIATLQDEIKKFPELTTNKMSGIKHGTFAVEIIGAEGTKQHGIFEISKHLKISTSEIIGIGDGYNDFPLLMACGLKIAMGNAVPDLKQIADFVCPSVEADGVAVVIEKLLLNS